MNINLYTFTGDPQRLLAAWNDALAGFDKSDFLLHVAAASDTGLSVIDVCPTEEDFQGWINGDAWAHVKASLGGDVVVTRLGEIQTAIARDDAVEIVRRRAHAEH